MTATEFAAARKRLGMTQREMELLLGIRRDTISKIERGKTKPGRAVILLLQALLDGYRPAGHQLTRQRAAALSEPAEIDDELI
jgi:transcriptional regulator with XRE-family HTH domain